MLTARIHASQALYGQYRNVTIHRSHFCMLVKLKRKGTVTLRHQNNLPPQKKCLLLEYRSKIIELLQKDSLIVKKNIFFKVDKKERK